MTARHPRGFTLMETIIAIVILSMAVPTMFWAIRDSQTKRANPVMISRARWLAIEKMEDVIADRHSSTRGYAYVLTSNYPAESPVTGFAGFTRTTTVNETAADLVSAGTGYKKVTVSVGFTDGKGAARTFSLATIVTDYSP